MSVRYLPLGLIVLAAVSGRSPVAAQDPTPADSGAIEGLLDLPGALGRPVEELVAELPGQPVALDELRRLARERSLELETTRLGRELAEAGVGILGGTFDLGLSFSAELARSRALPDRTATYGTALEQALPWGTVLGLGLSGRRTPTVGGTAYDADVGLSLSQPLLEGLGTRDADLRAARRLREAAGHRLARATETVLADVELAYWDLAEAEATEAVLLRSYDIAEALRFRNAQLAERDLAADVDVLTARSGVALRRALLVDAERRRLDASDALVFLVWGEAAPGRLAADARPLKTSGAPPDAGPAPSAEESARTALDQRRDLAAVRAELRGAEVLADAASNARLPSLDLDGAVRRGGTDPSLGGSLSALDRAWSWSVGVRFSQPLQNRRDRGLERDADLTTRLRRVDVVAVENAVRLDVRLAIRAVQAGAERAAAAEEAADLARAQLDAERQRLDLGLGDSFRLLQTEENLVQAALEAVRARYDLARARTRLRLAVGDEPSR